MTSSKLRSVRQRAVFGLLRRSLPGPEVLRPNPIHGLAVRRLQFTRKMRADDILGEVLPTLLFVISHVCSVPIRQIFRDLGQSSVTVTDAHAGHPVRSP